MSFETPQKLPKRESDQMEPQLYEFVDTVRNMFEEYMKPLKDQLTAISG